MTFSTFSGGLVNTVLAETGNQFGGSSFAVNDLIAGQVQAASGYTLNEGLNYGLSSISTAIPASTGNELTNAVATQVASVGLNQFQSFVTSLFTPGSASLPFVGGGSGIGNKGTISVPMDEVQKLPDAQYNSAFALDDIIFSVVPANAGPQTQEQPQTNPSMPWDVGYDEEAAKSLPAMDALKGQTALNGPAKGVNIGGRNYGAIYGNGKVTQLAPTSSLAKSIPVSW